MLINKPQSSNRLLTSTFVSRQFPLSGDGTEQNKLKISTQGLSANQFWMWDGTQWIASSGGGGSSLPSQTGNAGKFLTTDGTNASWSAALAIAASKILTVNNTLTLTGTDGSTINAGAGGNIAYTDVANTFTRNQIFTLPNLTGSSATNGISITQDWNTTGTPSAIKLNITTSTANANALLLDLNNVGLPVFSVSRTGQINFGNSATNGAKVFSTTAAGVPTSRGSALCLSGDARATSGYDVFIASANTRSSISGTSGLLNLLGSFGAAAGSSNYRAAEINYTLNNSGAQTGTATGIFLNATETALNGMTHNLMDLQVNGAARFNVNSTGGFSAAGNSGVTGFLNATTFQVASGTQILGANGNLLLRNSSATDFNRIQLGGTTASFPAIKRNGATIQSVLADDSGFANFSAGNITSTGNVVAQNGGIGTGITNVGLTLNNINFSTANTYSITMASGTQSQTSGTNGAVRINPTYNQTSGTASNTDLIINRTETAIGSGAQYFINAQVAGTSYFNINNKGKIGLDATNTAGGTTGAQTINKPSGTVNFAAGASSLVVTNSLVSTSSIVYAVVRTNDTTADIKNVVPANGSFTINLNAAATAETSVGFIVFN